MDSVVFFAILRSGWEIRLRFCFVFVEGTHFVPVSLCSCCFVCAVFVVVVVVWVYVCFFYIYVYFLTVFFNRYWIPFVFVLVFGFNPLLRTAFCLL